MKHKEWQNRKIDLLKVMEQETERQTPACEICKCLGNNECGHECLDEKNLCTLQPDMICPCCKKNK